MKCLATALAALVLCPTVALAQDQPQYTEALATFIDIEGAEIGTAQIVDTPNGVVFSLDLEGLEASSWVAFHIHENGECNAEDAFESAGGHFNPAGVDHGYFTEEGPHPGDMANQYVGADGILRTEAFNPFVRLDFDGENAIDGKALVIHGGRDDYQSQPSGDAGDRVACAVIGQSAAR